MISGPAFAALLEDHGFDLFTGVPCSLVEDLIAALERRARAPYVAAAREDIAVGVAAGAWLAGRRPAVIMQNSGLGTSLNALASLSLMYGLPALLLVTWRGHGGRDAPEHLLMGELTPRLLELLGVPARVLAPGSVADDVAWAAQEMDARGQPAALVVPPRVVEMRGAPAGGETAGAARRAPLVPTGPAELAAPELSRLAALAVAVKRLGDEPVVHANGYICRESYSLGDRPQNFYMIGSMGLASAIGLGVALARPERATVVFDGDANLLMSLGVLPMVGGLAPAGLVHCVFDNEVYGSTGNQRSPSRHARLDRLAAAAGYRTAAAVTGADALDAALVAALAAPGPHFILVKVTAEEAEVPRVPHAPAAIRDRFRASIAAG
ncbi:MAG TPA: thiamine pyrophosphate-dependent enzyme [Methylomirabilota bacterium]|nr:thiamine pyrophosphate-dependent enzyme [Methylomirabilota bacterium]